MALWIEMPIHILIANSKYLQHIHINFVEFFMIKHAGTIFH